MVGCGVELCLAMPRQTHSSQWASISTAASSTTIAGAAGVALEEAARVAIRSRARVMMRGHTIDVRASSFPLSPKT